MTTSSLPYRVLARKYRPSCFEDLIGQEAMVRTLSHAFALNKIHQAYLLTGVRGVGKTTTARILARALNYEPPDSKDPAASHPTLDMPELGRHCPAIIESRHMDVVEMDAASHTSVNDIRDLIDNARFKPVSARYKVYIIDEVHMLSKSAFDALLKTLEEPPTHVKFIFATTEIEKIPATIRSRCQRFDLRRVETDVLARHLRDIAKKEGTPMEMEACVLLARAAEGSVRDGLSLLDQVMAQAAVQEAPLQAQYLRHMLGLMDRSRLIDLFEHLLRGDMPPVLTLVKEQYDQGMDMATLLTDLASLTHVITSLKIAPTLRLDLSLTQEEVTRNHHLAQQLSLATLTRAWQMLTKGILEVKDSPRPLAATHMVLVRLAYAAHLPTPDMLLKALTHPEGIIPVSTPPSLPPGPAIKKVQNFQDILALAHAKRDIQMTLALEQDMRFVRMEEGYLEVVPTASASPQLLQTLGKKLQEWTGIVWKIVHSQETGSATMAEIAKEQEDQRRKNVKEDPLVAQTLHAFPDADIMAIRLHSLEENQEMAEQEE